MTIYIFQRYYLFGNEGKTFRENQFAPKVKRKKNVMSTKIHIFSIEEIDKEIMCFLEKNKKGNIKKRKK